MKITKIWKSRFPTIKKRQQIYRYFTTFLKLQNVCFCDPSTHFLRFFDGDCMVFRGNVAQKLFLTVVFWSFSSTFFDFRAKNCKNPTWTLSFLVLFELRRSSSSHSQNLFLTVVSWSFLETIFQYFHVNAVEQEGVDLEVFGRGANFDQNTGKWARKYRKQQQICRVLTYPFPTFPENLSKNLHICICFLVLWEPIFMEIMSHPESM